jgi:lysophospholipase L1-like esterase
LEQNPQQDILGINAGMIAATTAELRNLYFIQHRYLKPDILIIHTGGNDCDALMYADYNPQHTHFRTFGKGRYARKGEKYLVRHSEMAKLAYVWWLGDAQGVFNPGDITSVDRQKALKRVRDTYPLGFERNLDSMIALAKADGVMVILFPFLANTDEHGIVTRMPRQHMGLETAYTEAMIKHDAIMKQLAAKYDHVHYVEIDSANFKSEWFFDDCHLKENGHQMKAQILADYFASHHILDQVISKREEHKP